LSVEPEATEHRIGEVARLAGVTTRTIRYYEELGLLGTDAARPKGRHRVYGEANVRRLQELIRLRDLLGLSLEELVELAEVEEARAILRSRWERDPNNSERLQIILDATPIVERQLELVRTRQGALAQFAGELEEKLKDMRAYRAELERELAVTAHQDTAQNG
jgi:MerR family transcriptional regulator, repressor of the yfmOP operon